MASKYSWQFQTRVIGSKIALNLKVLHPLERSDGTPERKLMEKRTIPILPEFK